MAQDTISKATNIIELAMICGLAYLGYKVAVDLGLIGKKQGGGETPPEQPPGPGGLTPNGGNPVLDYIVTQPVTLPGGTDLSKLTPTVNTPVGPVGFGIPSLFSGGVAQIANAGSQPILQALWKWRMGYSNMSNEQIVNEQQRRKIEANRGAVGGGAGYGGTPQTRLSPTKPVIPTGGTWTKPAAPQAVQMPLNIRGMTGRLEPVKASDIISKPAAPTVVYNNTIGQRITIDQVMPRDRQNQVGGKTEAQQMAAYGALETKPVIPAPTPKDTTIWLWRDTRTGAVSTEPMTGWEKMTLDQAKARRYL